jgi:hypothetical protein
VLVAVTATWLAWSPGTRFGLAGGYGGWRYASIRLLDVGLVPLVIVGALCGSTPRDRRVDEQLRVAGMAPAQVVTATTLSGALVAIGVAVAFLLGAFAGGWLRALLGGASWWAGAGASAGFAADALDDLRLVVAVGLVGSIGALVGWIVRRDDAAVGLAVVLSIGYLPECSAALARLPVTIDLLAFTPLGALRATALADRGLAAAGYGRETPAWPFGLVLAGWCLVLVAAALPGRPSRHRRDHGHDGPAALVGVMSESSARRRARGRIAASRSALLAVMVVTTAGFGLVVPGRAADALPWRWQRSWRIAEQARWSSPQTVDRYLQVLLADPPGDPADLLVSAGAVSVAVASSIPRATRIERQPVATMSGPDHVVVRLDFADPVVSGSTAISSYVVRFSLQPDADQHWRIVGAEGPVAEAVTAASASGGS